MQLFFGTCLFFIAVVLLAYVPGKLLLIALKRELTPLEDVTLACVLGLVLSGLVYWLMTFAHQGTFLLRLAADRCWRVCLAPQQQTKSLLALFLKF